MIDVCKGSYLDVFVLILISIHQIQPPNRFGFGTGSESEPQAAVMVRSHAVLSRLEVITVNHFDSTLSTCADQCVKHYGFHAALQDPATHQPEKNMQFPFLDLGGNHGNHSVVAKLILQSPIKGNVSLIEIGRAHV